MNISSFTIPIASTLALAVVSALFLAVFMNARIVFVSLGTLQRGIVNFCRTSLFTWKTFFWIANIVCMGFSAQNAGFFFGLYEPIGVAVALVIDLAIIVFMQAMLSARARGEEGRARRIVGYIFLCAFLSTVGNLVHNLQVQDVNKVSHIASWFQLTLPFIASSIPMLLVVFALVADLVTKNSPLEATNVEEYRLQEQKRLDLKQVQIDTRKRQAKMHQETLTILAQEKENERLDKQIKSGKTPKSEPQKTLEGTPQAPIQKQHKLSLRERVTGIAKTVSIPVEKHPQEQVQKQVQEDEMKIKKSVSVEVQKQTTPVSETVSTPVVNTIKRVPETPPAQEKNTEKLRLVTKEKTPSKRQSKPFAKRVEQSVLTDEYVSAQVVSIMDAEPELSVRAVARKIGVPHSRIFKQWNSIRSANNEEKNTVSKHVERELVTV